MVSGGAPESLTPPDLPCDDSVGGDTSLSTVGTDLLESLRHSLVLNMEVPGSQIGFFLSFFDWR